MNFYKLGYMAIAVAGLVTWLLLLPGIFLWPVSVAHNPDGCL
jgi:hypothetical protein